LIKWIASKYFLYSFLFLVIVRLLSGANSEFKIGFISSFDAGEKESIAAHDFFVKKYAKSEVLNFSDIKNNSSSLTDIKVLWFHRPDSSNFAAVETDPKVITTIKNYLQNGGNLLLTLDAFRYLKPLGLDTVEPQVRYVIAADQGYGRNLGLHAFRSHPVFDGLHGGAYIFNPVTDYKCRQIGYFGSSVPENGKVVAVDWAYITLKEDSKLMLEYKVGKGRVLAIGAYTFFQPENKNRMHLEKFIENCMNYLAGNSRDQQKQYWNYETAVIVPFDEPVLNTDKITLKEAESWSREDNPMTLKSRFASDNAWDVAGRQIVLLGKEKGGITEAWAHPFMAFWDYEVGIQFSYKDTVYWLNNERPSIEVLPESFTRTYKFRRAYLTEIISVGMNDPIVIVHYEYRGVYPAKLIIKYKTNFRFMWPYSDKVLGSLYYRWDDQLNAFYVTTKDTSFALIQGASKIPELKLSGRYSDFEKADQSFIGNPTNTFSASFLEQFNLKMNDNLNIVFSASSTGFKNAVENYNNTIENPYVIYK